MRGAVTEFPELDHAAPGRPVETVSNRCEDPMLLSPKQRIPSKLRTAAKSGP